MLILILQKKKTIVSNNVALTVNDYNSTKLVFNFNREDGIKVFEMKNSKGELVFLDEIENNEILLGGRTEDDQPASLFPTAGEYVFEVSLYTNNSKLTSASGKLVVENETVVTESEALNQYLPLITKLADLPEIHNCYELFKYGIRLNEIDNVIKACRNTTNVHRMFESCSSVTSLNLNDFDFSKITDSSYMFSGCSKLEHIYTKKPINLSSLKTCSGMFSSCNSLKEIIFDTSIENNTLSTLNYCFRGCKELVSIDLSWICSNKIDNMESTFNDCINLKSVNLSNLHDLPKLTTMSNLFYNCSSFTSIDLSNLGENNISSMGNIFYNCINLESINFGNFKPAAITYLGGAFSGCSKLTSVDFLHEWKLSKLRNLENTFKGCSSLTSIDLSNLGKMEYRYNFENIRGAFDGCTNLTSLDLSNAETYYLSDWTNTFRGCENLENLKIRFQRGNSDLTKCPDLSQCPKLTSESIAYILQNLREYTSSSSTYTLKLGEVNLAKATQEDLDAAVAKGWTII